MHWRLHNLMVGAWMVWRVRICRMVRRRRGYIVVQWILLRVAWLLRRRAGLLWLLLLKLLWILWIVGRLVRRWRCAVEAREGGRRCVSGELPGGVGDGRDAILRERLRGRHRRVGLLFDLSSFGHDDRESLRIIRQRHWKG